MGCTTCGSSGAPTQSSSCSDPVGNYQLVNNSGCPDCCKDMSLANDCKDLLDETQKVQDYVCGQQAQMANVKLLFKKTTTKLTCVIKNIIKNLCCLNTRVDKIGNYVSTLQLPRPQQSYTRTSAVDLNAMGHPYNSNGHIDVYMDGSTSSWNDVSYGNKKVADQDYIVSVDWCNDPTAITVEQNQGATWQVTAYASGSTIDRQTWSRHVQVNAGDWAIPAHDTIIVKKGEHIIIDVNYQGGGTGGIFRVHQIHTSWTPITMNSTAPDFKSC